MEFVGEVFQVQRFEVSSRTGAMLSERGVAVNILPSSHLELELTPGILVRAAVERDGNRYVAKHVQRWEPSDTLLEEFSRRVERYDTAGLDLEIREPAAYLVSTLTRGGLQARIQWDPEKHLFDRLTRHFSVFPMIWWHDDIQPALDEMVELMRAEGYVYEPSSLLTQRAESSLNEARSEEDEDRCRERLCEALIKAANEVLILEEDDRRFRPFKAPSWDGDNDVYWVLLDDVQAQRLERYPLFD